MDILSLDNMSVGKEESGGAWALYGLLCVAFSCFCCRLNLNFTSFYFLLHIDFFNTYQITLGHSQKGSLGVYVFFQLERRMGLTDCFLIFFP